MALEQYANFATTTLNGAINNSTTSVVVTDGSVFPASGDFRVVIESEIMRCTARSSNTLTVVRGVEGTTAASHADTLEVKSPLTKASIKKLIEDNILRGAVASRPSAGEPGRLYLPTDSHVILRDNGTIWQPFGPIRALKNPNDFSWTQERYSSVAGEWQSQDFSQTLFYPTIGSSGIGFCSISTPAPSAPYKITALIVDFPHESEYSQCGIGFYNTSDNKVSFVRIAVDNNFKSPIVRTHAGGWDQSGESNTTNFNLRYTPYHWFQIEDDNTNHYFRYSVDGVNWYLVNQESRTAYLSGSADKLWWGGQLFGLGEYRGFSLLSWLQE